MAKVRRLKFNVFSNDSGDLVPIEGNQDVPFNIRRIFYIRPNGCGDRGKHAHRECEQVLVAVYGSFRAEFTDSRLCEETYLITENNAIYVPCGIWNRLYDFSIGCVIMVLCSHPYNEGEYIRDFVEFKDYVALETQRIKVCDIAAQTRSIRGELDNKIRDIVDSGRFILGPETTKFEAAFAKFHKVAHCVTLSNGTSALRVAIKALNLLPGSKIAVQANTYIAAPLAIEQCGMVPIVVDIDTELNVDLGDLESKLRSEQIAAVIIVYLYGCCPNMIRLMALKERHRFALIEDTAQATGCMWNGNYLGTFGKVGCFSFYPTKNLGCFGDGGAIITNDPEIWSFARKYRNYGSTKRYKWEIKGSNERMDELQAGILNVKLKYLHLWNSSRVDLAKIYERELAEVAGIRIPKNLPQLTRTYHLFVILVEHRDYIHETLQFGGKCTDIHYPATFYTSEAFSELNHIRTRADEYKEKILSLPLHPEMTPNDVILVCNKLKELLMEKNEILQ